MPPARRVRVLVIHVFCSPGRLAGHPPRTPANHHDEAADTESQDAYYDDVHPPLHVDHDLSTSLPLPLAAGHTRTDQKVVATSSCPLRGPTRESRAVPGGYARTVSDVG